MKRIKELIVCLLFSCAAVGQERSEIIQQRIEFVAEQAGSEEPDLINLFDQLNYFFDHPVNLNNADPEDLRALGLLADVQIANLQSHIMRFGKLISIYELQELEYWDLSTIRIVQPFVRVDDRLDQLHLTFREAIKEGKFELYTRYQRTPQFRPAYAHVPDSVKELSSKYYYGNPDRYYARFRYTYRNNISVGVTAEKDPGEQFFRGTQSRGFDFYSAHAFYKGGKYLRSVAAGDYLVQIGQGLNVWSGYAFGKTADVFASRKSAVMLRPYTSVDENRFYRGAAAVAGSGRFSLLAFYSGKRTDGKTTADTLTENAEVISSVNLSGLHRTHGEIAGKNTVFEQALGSYIHYSAPAFSGGIAVVNQSYNAPLQRDSVPYNLYAFRGKSTTGISGDYSYVFRNLNFFGEVSCSTHPMAFAQLHGLMAVLDPRVSVSVIYRNYARNYYTFHNNGFSEGSDTRNESGIFMGAKVRLNSSWYVNAYADFFRFPWLKYMVDAPSTGNEFLVQPVYKPNKELEIYGRFRQQLRQKNSRDDDGTITELVDVVQRNYRLNANYKVSEDFTLKSRVEYVTINRPDNKKEEGWIFTQDVIFRPKSLPFDLSLRYALFDTDSYDTRIYTFENNALYVFSVPAYYYQGSRAYAMIRYSFLRVCDLWVRYGVFLYSNRSTIGSGGEQITGSKKSDITAQLRISF